MLTDLSNYIVWETIRNVDRSIDESPAIGVVSWDELCKCTCWHRQTSASCTPNHVRLRKRYSQIMRVITRCQ